MPLLTRPNPSYISSATCMVDVRSPRRSWRSELPSTGDGRGLRAQPQNPHAEGREGCEQGEVCPASSATDGAAESTRIYCIFTSIEMGGTLSSKRMTRLAHGMRRVQSDHLSDDELVEQHPDAAEILLDGWGRAFAPAPSRGPSRAAPVGKTKAEPKVRSSMPGTTLRLPSTACPSPTALPRFRP
jgi:hypothetical protein